MTETAAEPPDAVMRIVVIGATGHIGGYLVPMLVEQGHDVVAVSRGQSRLYRDTPAWSEVSMVPADRAAEDDVAFARRVAALGADVVVDLICFAESAARAMRTELEGRVTLLVHVGTIWVHGTLTEVPVTEECAAAPVGFVRRFRRRRSKGTSWPNPRRPDSRSRSCIRDTSAVPDGRW